VTAGLNDKVAKSLADSSLQLSAYDESIVTTRQPRGGNSLKRYIQRLIIDLKFNSCSLDNNSSLSAAALK
jgi:hypothetical protein